MKGSSIWVKFEFQNSENMKSIAKRVKELIMCLFAYLASTLFFNKLNTATNFEFNKGSILILQGTMFARHHT
jgi:hypothetical protein